MNMDDQLGERCVELMPDFYGPPQPPGNILGHTGRQLHVAGLAREDRAAFDAIVRRVFRQPRQLPTGD